MQTNRPFKLSLILLILVISSTNALVIPLNRNVVVDFARQEQDGNPALRSLPDYDYTPLLARGDHPNNPEAEEAAASESASLPPPAARMPQQSAQGENDNAGGKLARKKRTKKPVSDYIAEYTISSSSRTPAGHVATPGPAIASEPQSQSQSQSQPGTTTNPDPKAPLNPKPNENPSGAGGKRKRTNANASVEGGPKPSKRQKKDLDPNSAPPLVESGSSQSPKQSTSVIPLPKILGFNPTAYNKPLVNVNDDRTVTPASGQQFQSTDAPLNGRKRKNVPAAAAAASGNPPNTKPKRQKTNLKDVNPLPSVDSGSGSGPPWRSTSKIPPPEPFRSSTLQAAGQTHVDHPGPASASSGGQQHSQLQPETTTTTTTRQQKQDPKPISVGQRRSSRIANSTKPQAINAAKEGHAEDKKKVPVVGEVKGENPNPNTPKQEGEDNTGTRGEAYYESIYSVPSSPEVVPGGSTSTSTSIGNGGSGGSGTLPAHTHAGAGAHPHDASLNHAPGPGPAAGGGEQRLSQPKASTAAKEKKEKNLTVTAPAGRRGQKKGPSKVDIPNSATVSEAGQDRTTAVGHGHVPLPSEGGGGGGEANPPPNHHHHQQQQQEESTPHAVAPPPSLAEVKNQPAAGRQSQRKQRKGKGKDTPNAVSDHEAGQDHGRTTAVGVGRDGHGHGHAPSEGGEANPSNHQHQQQLESTPHAVAPPSHGEAGAPSEESLSSHTRIHRDHPSAVTTTTTTHPPSPNAANDNPSSHPWTNININHPPTYPPPASIEEANPPNHHQHPEHESTHVVAPPPLGNAAGSESKHKYKWFPHPLTVTTTTATTTATDQSSPNPNPAHDHKEHEFVNYPSTKPPPPFDPDDPHLLAVLGGDKPPRRKRTGKTTNRNPPSTASEGGQSQTTVGHGPSEGGEGKEANPSIQQLTFPALLPSPDIKPSKGGVEVHDTNLLPKPQNLSPDSGSRLSPYTLPNSPPSTIPIHNNAVVGGDRTPLISNQQQEPGGVSEKRADHKDLPRLNTHVQDHAIISSTVVGENSSAGGQHPPAGVRPLQSNDNPPPQYTHAGSTDSNLIAPNTNPTSRFRPMTPPLGDSNAFVGTGVDDIPTRLSSMSPTLTPNLGQKYNDVSPLTTPSRVMKTPVSLSPLFGISSLGNEHGEHGEHEHE